MNAQSLPGDFAHLIDGEMVSGKEWFDVVNPATGMAFARAPLLSRAGRRNSGRGRRVRDSGGARRPTAPTPQPAPAADDLAKVALLDQHRGRHA